VKWLRLRRHSSKFSLTIISTLLSFVLAGAARPAYADCVRPWIYFDLGGTLVDSNTHHYDPMYYVRVPESFLDHRDYPTARHYIDALVKRGYILGLITDVPPAWGVNYPPEAPIQNRGTARLIRTMDFLAGRLPEDSSRWEDPLFASFDWLAFGKFRHGVNAGPQRIFDGRILLPHTLDERKDSNSLVLFERARRAAAARGCRAIFQGDSLNETQLAEKAGLPAYHVGTPGLDSYYLPISEIDSYGTRTKISPTGPVGQKPDRPTSPVQQAPSYPSSTGSQISTATPGPWVQKPSTAGQEPSVRQASEAQNPTPVVPGFLD
jgi:hypothetical protein